MFSFKDFVSSNHTQKVSRLDYIHLVYNSQSLSEDFIISFCELMWPNFRRVDGLIFVSELFDEERYQELKVNKNNKEVQFWSNLLEITGLFNEISTEQALLVAKMISESWNAKMRSEYGIAEAKWIYDKETEEVFVTLGGAN